jgi:hypothetical protein
VLKTRNNHFLSNPRAAIGAAVASAAMVASFGIAVPSSGASTMRSAAPSAFCTTLLQLAKVKAPTTSNLGNYRKWLKTYLPYYRKLAKQAPSSAKKVLGELVTVMQYESKTASALKLEKYISTHSKQWTNGWKAFANAAVSCATSMYG